MTQKDFELIAGVLRKTRPSETAVVGTPNRTQADAEWTNTVEQFADALEDTNPRFDRDRFVAACQKGA